MKPQVIRPSARTDAGWVLLAVLIVLLVVAGSSASFIWFMNQQQTRVGLRYRSTAAMALAEAGVHRALSILEAIAPDGTSGREWRPAGYSEAVPVGSLEGRFTISLRNENDGAIVVNSVGDVGGVSRRLRARVYLASAAQLAALYGTSVVRLEHPPAATVIIPYPASVGDLPWIHIAVGAGIWFATTTAATNQPPPTLSNGPGQVGGVPNVDAAAPPPRPGLIRLLLAKNAELFIGRDQEQVDIQQLRAMGAHVEVGLRPEGFPAPPEVDRDFYRAKAAFNDANATLNRATGKYFGDASLANKPDSLYSSGQFEQLQAYANSVGQPLQLQGVVYVTGGLSLVERDRLHITDGTLVTEASVSLDHGASLEITHNAVTRTLPGLLILNDGALVATQEARLRIHGLVYVNRLFEISEGAQADIVGSVLANDPGLSFRNSGGSIVIRYDPAVLGTPGLRVPGDQPVVAWVASWEELEGPAPMIPPVPLVARPETPPRSEPAAPVPPPASLVLPSPTAPPAAAPVAPSPQPLGMAPSLRTPPIVVRRPEQPSVDQAPTPAVGPSPSESPAPVRSSHRARTAESPREQGLFTVQVGAFSIRENAEERTAALRRAGFPPRIVVDRGLYKVRVGAYHDRARAEELADQLRARGYAVIIVQ